MPSSSPSSSSSSSSSSNAGEFRNERNDGTKTNNNADTDPNAKYLVEIPLLPQPPIQCSNLVGLADTSFVNVVLENVGGPNESYSSSYFRVSDESNKELCRVKQNDDKKGGRTTQLHRKGIEYLECCDATGHCVMLIAYPIGLGEVVLLSPKEEILGECQSNVAFICLSVKVKYNFYDMNGNRLMKMTALLREEGNEKKFSLMVKRSEKEKLALIKMGSLKTCCHIKFKQGQTSVLERLQIIALWTGFMHNELKDTVTPSLLEKQAAMKLERKESRKKRKKLQVTDANPPELTPSQTDREVPSSTRKTTNDNGHPHPPPEQMQLSSLENEDSERKNRSKWKSLVKSSISPKKHKRQYQVNNNEGEGKDQQQRSKSTKQIVSFAKPKIMSHVGVDGDLEVGV